LFLDFNLIDGILSRNETITDSGIWTKKPLFSKKKHFSFNDGSELSSIAFVVENFRFINDAKQETYKRTELSARFGFSDESELKAMARKLTLKFKDLISCKNNGDEQLSSKINVSKFAQGLF
jgi:hypothetical protein